MNNCMCCFKNVDSLLSFAYFHKLSPFFAALQGSRAAETADYVARDVYEYIRGIDYQTYYDSVGGAMGVRGGSGQKELFDYSQQSAVAAGKKLEEFLALMPRDQVEAAQQQASTLPF